MDIYFLVGFAFTISLILFAVFIIRALKKYKMETKKPDNLEILKIRGEQLADQEAIQQLFEQLKVLCDYLGVEYLPYAKKIVNK